MALLFVGCLAVLASLACGSNGPVSRSGGYDDKAHLYNTKHKIDNYLAKTELLGKNRLQVNVKYLNTPLEYQYLNQYHGFEHPLSYTKIAPKFGLPYHGAGRPLFSHAGAWQPAQTSGFNPQQFYGQHSYIVPAYTKPPIIGQYPYIQQRPLPQQTYTQQPSRGQQTYTQQPSRVQPTYTLQPSYVQQTYTQQPSHVQQTYTQQPTHVQETYAQQPSHVQQTYAQQPSHVQQTYAQQPAHVQQTYAQQPSHVQQTYAQQPSHVQQTYAQQPAHVQQMYTQQPSHVQQPSYGQQFTQQPAPAQQTYSQETADGQQTYTQQPSFEHQASAKPSTSYGISQQPSQYQDQAQFDPLIFGDGGSLSSVTESAYGASAVVNDGSIGQSNLPSYDQSYGVPQR